MRVITVLIGVILLVLLCSLPAHAQHRTPSGLGYSLNGSSSLNGKGSLVSASSASHLTYSPQAQFRIMLVSGSEDEFVPSSFMVFDRAVTLGTANPAHGVFMSFDQAVQKGLADLDAPAKSLAEVARQYRRQRQRDAQADSRRDRTTL